MTAKNDFLSLLLKAHSHLTQSDLETKWASAFQQRVMISLRGGSCVQLGDSNQFKSKL